MSETGLLPAVVLAATLLKDIGIFVAASSIASWLLEPDAVDDEAGSTGWIADFQRQLWVDRYQYVYDTHADHLTGAGKMSLKLSVALAKKAVMEPTSVVWQGHVLLRGLQVKAEKLMALEQGHSGPSGVKLLPEVEWSGAGFDITVGDDEPQAAPVSTAWILAGLLGLGAAVFLWRTV